MSNPRNKRLGRELLDCQKDKESGIKVVQVDGSLDHLRGSFPGPSGTSYEGGVFDVDIVVPDRYPFAPLKMTFITKLYHVNVSSATGFICLDTLGAGWSPVLTIRTALVSLASLLSTPEPSDPQDAEVAKHFLTDRPSFEATAKYWTQVYAKGTTQVAPINEAEDYQLAGLDSAHVERFVAMGFPRMDVISVLKQVNYRGSNVANVTDDTVLEKLL